MSTERAETHRTLEELEAGLEHVRAAPAELGTVELIVRRPAVGERDVLTECELDLDEGVVGDNWSTRGSSKTPDGSAHPDKQVNMMSARFAELIAGARERWPLAGDQLYVDLDLSETNLPPGTHLELGSAVLVVTDQPHLGCRKFAQRFGKPAAKLVRTDEGRALHLRGLNTRVVRAGRVRVGDPIRRRPSEGRPD